VKFSRWRGYATLWPRVPATTLATRGYFTAEIRVAAAGVFGHIAAYGLTDA